MKIKLFTTEIYDIPDDTQPVEILDKLVGMQASFDMEDLPEDVWWNWRPVDLAVLSRWGLTERDIDNWLEAHGETRG